MARPNALVFAAVVATALTVLNAGGVNAAQKAAPSFLFLLGDDIGWGDLSMNNGTAATPNIDAWRKRQGSILMQDMHSGGTVCSPTRASVLTGRTSFRDCINYVFDCSDPTECEPDFPFAPKRTFTIADAARAQTKHNTPYTSFFTGKWHLGALYNDSAVPSSPTTHGFDHFNATIEVAPTQDTNWQCNVGWNEHVDYGHYHKPTHCNGGANPGGPSLQNGCCFNYWRNSDTSEHGVTNLTTQTPPDDTVYLSNAFDAFLTSLDGGPFVAQISFHNCHIPFIGGNASRVACQNNETCVPPVGAPYTDAELDYYACLTEMDAGVGRILSALDSKGYYDNTLTWFATDNGPEINCRPEGFCKGTEHRPLQAPGSAGPLRGRKRDIWEGGHRVPGVVSWPAVVKGTRESWDLVITDDFLPTIMDVLDVERPSSQADWALDGMSIMPILLGQEWPDRPFGIMFDTPSASPVKGYGFRYGDWKYVVGSVSCSRPSCQKPQLYNLATDLGEKHDVSSQYPDVLKAIEANFTAWHASVLNSINHESECASATGYADMPRFTEDLLVSSV